MLGMDETPNNRRITSMLLLLIGAVLIITAAVVTAIAVANWLSNPFPAIPQTVNRTAPFCATVVALTAVLCIWCGLSLRR